MARYRKKPVEVDAYKWEGSFFVDGVNASPKWMQDALADRTAYLEGKGELYIRTLEGVHHASVGDYVIRSVKGELYPCKPDVFEQTYEPVSQWDGRLAGLDDEFEEGIR